MLTGVSARIDNGGQGGPGGGGPGGPSIGVMLLADSTVVGANAESMALGSGAFGGSSLAAGHGAARASARTCSKARSGVQEPAARAQLLAPAVVGSPAVCLAWNAAIRSAISCAWVASAKWPVSRR
jgi:hypothetical protein